MTTVGLTSSGIWRDMVLKTMERDSLFENILRGNKRKLSRVEKIKLFLNKHLGTHFDVEVYERFHIPIDSKSVSFKWYKPNREDHKE